MAVTNIRSSWASGNLTFGLGATAADRLLNYFELDGTSNQQIHILKTSAGGDSPQGVNIDADCLAGTSGFRQGAVNIAMARASAQAFTATWDGNADEALKISSRNSASNLDGGTRIGAARALNVQARNSGTNLSWVKTIECNARNDSGKNVSELLGLHIRCENYGNVYTSNIGIDVEMSDENTTQSQPRIGAQFRNTDASAMSACDAVMKVSHSGTNGWTNILHLASATGDGFTAGELDDNAGQDVNCDGYLTIKVNATPYYIPCFDTAA